MYLPERLRNIIAEPKSTAWGAAALGVAGTLFGFIVGHDGLEGLTSAEGLGVLGFLLTGLTGLLKKDNKKISL